MTEAERALAEAESEWHTEGGIDALVALAEAERALEDQWQAEAAEADRLRWGD